MKGFKIVIASGKGGTGKTTVATNLAIASPPPVRLLDCDVEEPNAHLFFERTPSGEEIVTIPVPEVNEKQCDGCGECARFCRYNAIACYGSIPIIFAEMCHGCGGCEIVCPRKAIREIPKRIGVIDVSSADGLSLVTGRLDVGVPTSPPLVRAVKAKVDDGAINILDAPPGTSCPVVTAMKGADCVVLVTEPTPFGLHDLKLAVDTVGELSIPFGVVVNRAGSGDNRVGEYCAERGIPLLMELPDDRRVAEAYSRGEAAATAIPGYRELFVLLLEKIGQLAEGSAPGGKVRTP